MDRYPLVLENAHRVIDEYLYMPDKLPLHVVLATKAAVHMDCDPIWLMLIGPSSSGKSEIIRSMREDADCYFTNNFTSASLLSGYNEEGRGKKKGKQDAEEVTLDLLPKLNNKTLLVPDLGSILSKPDQNQSQLFTALCDCYDGGYVADFGTVGHKEAKARFGFIGGTIEVVDTFATKLAAFGQRFIRICIRYSEPEAFEALSKASSVAGKESQMRTEIAAAIALVNADMKRRIPEYSNLPVEPHVTVALEALCGAVAAMRTGILTDARTGAANYLPHQEMGMRAMKELSNLGRAIACLYKHDTVGEDEYQVLKRVAGDCIPEIRLVIAKHLMDGFMTRRDLAYKMHVPPTWLQAALDHLYGLGVLEHDDTGMELRWRVTDYYQEIFTHSDIFNSYKAA